MKGNALDMLSEVGEFTLDYFLKEGVLKDFPLIGSVLKILQAGNDISNLIFAKKLQAFISKLNEHDITAVDENILDKEKLSELGCELIFIIDNAQNVNRAEWLAQAVIGLSEKRYDVDTFQRLINVIQRYSPPLSKCMGSYYADISMGFDEDYQYELSNLGLLKHNPIYITQYHVTNLGQAMWYVLEKSGEIERLSKNK
ncbi:hypothetical protein [Aeromonas dhakensis]|uniref:hypothetical protein n=1 Tax=Aeromonas dhakensis TaxID=196024 RepID=UPI000C0BF301|nr:hypothetical protein [Aeromonas dhakensis]PHS82772.1 hypothetical protein AAW02_21505 [Aeromonas dhakensis]PHS83783.1 hypothetical protein AAW03_18675 [Aeromonas dhakensis]